MKNLTKSLILGFILALMYLPPLHAQTEGSTSADTRPSAASPTTPGQAPDEVMKKLSNLVHAGNYVEARQLTTGLLLAYPDDQRLLKAKVLLDEAASSSNPAATGPNMNPPLASVTAAATDANPTHFIGMDKVDYIALIQRARIAQQTTDLAQQNTLLKQFMEDSHEFLRKYPNQTLLWQLRAASAISLDDMLAGNEAGEKLLSMGSAESNDPNLEQLLGQLKNKGWFDKQKVEERRIYGDKEEKFGWLLGTWEVQWSWKLPYAASARPRLKEEFYLSGATIEGYVIRYDGYRCDKPDLRGTILESGEIKWESYLPPYDSGDHYIFRSGGTGWMKALTAKAGIPGDFWLPYGAGSMNVEGGPFYPSGWQPVISSENDLKKGAMTMVIPSQRADPHSNTPLKYPVTLSFTKAGDSQSKLTPRLEMVPK